MKIIKIPIICGPTTVGKTKTAIELAKIIKGQIISCDRFTFYSGVKSIRDIKQLEESIKCHFYGILGLNERTWSAEKYVSEVESLIPKIIRKGYIPIIEGFSGKYLDALIACNAKKNRDFFYVPICIVYPENTNLGLILKERLSKGIKEDLLDETKDLMEKNPNCFPIKCGAIYKHIVKYLEKDISIEEAITRSVNEALTLVIPLELGTFDRFPEMICIKEETKNPKILAKKIQEIILEKNNSKIKWRDLSKAQKELLRNTIIQRELNTKENFAKLEFKMREALPGGNVLDKTYLESEIMKLKKTYFL
ncbi:hypothetical protein GOV14_05870 [Candidatus Pacearchaeota archaeon]|nr:hypothetical protein [Candidatus Pacearchaeota archaeon]